MMFRLSVKKMYKVLVVLFMMFANFTTTAGILKATALDGSTSIDYPNPGSVLLDKTEVDIGSGLYEITLDISGIPLVKASDIVLVMDISGSMEGDKIAAAKVAAKNFIDAIIAKNQNHRIAIVTFADQPVLVSGFSTDATTLKAAIDTMQSDGGTHLEGGIYTATNLLTGSGLSSNNKVIVVLGDGQPTYGYDFTPVYTGPLDYSVRNGHCRVSVSQANQDNGANYEGRFVFDYSKRVGSGNSIDFSKSINVSGTCPTGGTDDYHFDKVYTLEDSVYWQADRAKNLGISVFSIGLEVNSTGSRILNAIQNSGYYDAQADDLTAVYNAIASQVMFAARSAVIIDKIGDDFEFVEMSDGYQMLDASYDESTRILTWNVGNVGATSLILKYIISIHPGLPNGEYPTNEYATVNYINIFDQPSDNTFPQPTVVISNEVPVAVDDEFTVNEGETHLGSVVAVDPEGDLLTYQVVSLPSHGNLVILPDGSFTYIHDGSETTTDSFTFKATDGTFESNIATITITILPVNDLPVSYDQSISVNEAATFIGQLIATDAENDGLIYTAVALPSFGTLTVNSDGSFTYVHDGSEHFIDSFTFKVNDGHGDSNIATVTITIGSGNDAPVTLDDAFTVNEGGTHLGQLTATDDDDTSFTFTAISLPLYGTLMVNPDGSFTYVHDGSEHFSDSFTYKANDGEADSNVSTVTITINPVNDAPVTLDDAFTVNEGGTHLGQLTATDDDDTSFTITAISLPLYGTLMVNPDGSFTYVHDGSEHFSDSFTYKANDGEVDSNISTVTITINPVNDAPVAQDQYIIVSEGESYPTLPALAHLTAIDPDDSDLVFSLIDNGTNGFAVVNPDGTFTYIHDGSETSSDWFNFSVSDGSEIDYGTVYITINGGNDVPDALDEYISLDEGSIYPILPTFAQLDAIDSDSSPDNLVFVQHSSPSHGLAVVNSDGTFTYIHDGSENFTDSFQFLVFDEGFLSDIATVYITINPVNDAPVTLDDAFTVNEGGTHLGQLTATDDDDTSFTITAISLPLYGTLMVNPDGSFTYVHDGSEHFSDSFTYKANDGEVDSNISTVTITINPVNDAPIAYPDRFDVLEGGTHSDYFMWSDSDGSIIPAGFYPSIPFLMSFEIVDQPRYGTVSLTSPFGDYDYVHDGSESTTDFFTFRVFDGYIWSEPARVDITIIPVNDPPVVVDQNLNVDEGGELPGQLEATDPDDTDFTFELVGDPANGSVVINPDGSFTYIHDGSETLTDSFTYKANDGEAGSNVATVYITINPLNDVPEADDDGFTVDEGGVYNGQLTGMDPDTPMNEWIFVLDDEPLFGGLTFNADGSYEYTHNGSETTSDFFTFHISDGFGDSNIATVEITINPQNDLPVANDFAFTLLQGAIYNNSLFAADNDNAILNFQVVDLPTHGTLVLNADGSFSYDHDGINLLPDFFTYRVFDGQGYSNTATVTIGINPLPPLNAAPITLPEAFTVAEGGREIGAVAGLDADGDPIIFLLVETVTNGTLVFAANGTYTYDHNGTETTTDTFRFRAWDGKAYSGIRTAFITITPVNDAPVAVNGTDETDFETALTGNIHGLISDVDSADWTLAVSTTTAHGTLVLNADGSFTYTPEAGFSGDDVFTFRANDGTLDSNIATFTITVNEEVVIDDPVTPLSPLSFWWAYLLGLLFLLIFFLRPNLKYALVDKNGKETIVRRHIFANGKDDLFVDLDDKNIEGLVAVDLVIYKQLVKRERGNKITFNLFKKPAKVINVPEDLKEAIEDKIKL